MAQVSENLFRCPMCQRELPKDAFRKDKNRPHGIDARCKKCRRQDAVTNKPRECARRKRYRDRVGKQEDPKKAAARTKAQRVFKKPKMCQACGKRRGERHHAALHDAYSAENALNIVWLCRTCHSNSHILMRCRQRTAPSFM